MRTIAILLLAVAMLTAADQAQAAGRRRAAARPTYGTDPRALYPKYYGGFHARALQNIGIPTGDIGIRGNGIYANPW